MGENIGQADAEYLWQCAPSTELKGYAKHYGDGGCYTWQVRSSRIRITAKRGIQGKCKNCGRRPRLKAHLVEAMFDEEEAKAEAYIRNKTLQGVPSVHEVEDYHDSMQLHPNTTEWIE